MLAIYKKELRSYFTSMVGYVYIAFFLVIVGIGYFYDNLINGYANFEYALSDITFIAILLTPILTMRLMAEENKQKTDQLLLTSPLNASSIVIGKLLAVITVFFAGMLVTCMYPLILTKFGTVPLASSYAAIFGFIMMISAYLSIGFYISSLTESQVVAAVTTFIVFLFTIFMDGLAKSLPTGGQTAFIVFSVILIAISVILYRMMHNVTLSVGTWLIVEVALTVAYVLKPTLFDGSVVGVFGWFSVITRYDQFRLQIFDITGIIYYLSITVLFAFLTTQVIRKKRWS